MAKPGLLALLAVFGGFSAGADPAAPPYPERGMKGTVTLAKLPPAPHPFLAAGGAIWDENCRVCHGSGLAGAPKITGTRFWADRITQGLDVLLVHAKEGFTGKTGTMPERGGNLDLTDEDLEAAIRFMIFHSGGAKEALAGLK